MTGCPSGVDSAGQLYPRNWSTRVRHIELSPVLHAVITPLFDEARAAAARLSAGPFRGTDSSQDIGAITEAGQPLLHGQIGSAMHNY
jgi:hypothetical protein